MLCKAFSLSIYPVFCYDQQRLRFVAVVSENYYRMLQPFNRFRFWTLDIVK
ncbi:MAG: hypothetical protein OFPI_15830 [Osedax symbiont Rs2]|nr:MAG: hypothetical protein OFPI_15830 [Osedax symbiont Rs2]